MEITKLTLEINVESSAEAAEVVNMLAKNGAVLQQVENAEKRRGRPRVTKPEQPEELPGQQELPFGDSEPAKPAEPEKPAKPAKAAAVPKAGDGGQEVTLDMLRTLTSEKINEHRPEIKAKLNELGSQNITKLDTARYAEMYEFLQSL